MDERPPFDLKRAVFWLVAGYVAAHIVIVFAGVGFCLAHGREIIEGKYHCDPNNKLSDLLDRPFAYMGDVLKPTGGKPKL